MITKRRVARKAHRCDSCTKPNIQPGHVYLVHTIFPNDDVSGWDTPQRSIECADCAGRYGREHELGRIPDEQPYRYWLGDSKPQPPDPLGGAS